MCTLDYDANLQPVLPVPGAWPASRALAALQSSDAAFALVEEDGRPQSLASEPDLERLGQSRLAERLNELPGLVCIDASVHVLDLDDLVRLASLLLDGGAPGFVVMAGEQVTGAVGGDDVDAVLPLDAIGTSRMSGDPGVPTPWYICRKCQPSPAGGHRSTVPSGPSAPGTGCTAQ